MRLVFCTTDGQGAFNGINAWLLGFLPGLIADGHQAEAWVLPWSPPRACRTLPLLRAAGVPVRVFHPRRYTGAQAGALARAAARARPDIFVANMVTPALMAMPALRTAGIPGVSVLHNDDEEYRAKASLPADATVVISRGLLAMVPADGRTVRCIPYGMALSAGRARPAAQGGAFRLVYHGRIAREQKRIVETAEALVRVCNANPRVEADFVGDGPDTGALLACLARGDAGGRVRYLGPRSPAELADMLPSYQAAVLLSDFEGLGLSILEGMAAGLVPVCLRTRSGLPDLIEDGANGLFVDDRGPGFDAAVAHLSADPDLWARLSAGAVGTVAGTFAPAVSRAAWLDLARALAGARGPAAGVPRRINLPPPLPALAAEDLRYPGAARAWWRFLRFGPSRSCLPW